MTRKKLKLVPVMNESSRALSLKKRRLGLVKKVRELTILCDVKACMIIFNPKEMEPMIWPSLEATHDLLDDFFALPDTEQKKKETSLDSYLKEKTKKAHEQLNKIHKKNMEYMIDQLMMQLSHCRGIADLNLNEIYTILSFSKDKIMHFRKKLDFLAHLPLRDPPIYLFETQSEELRTNTNDVFIGDNDENEIASEADEASRRFNIGILRDDQSHYLMDRWVFASSDHENPTEMELVGSQVMTFQNMLGPISQPLQYHYINNNSIMNLNQPRINNIMETNDGVNQEPSSYGRMAQSFDINKVWPRINHHF